MMFMRRSPFGMFLLLGVGVLLGAALFGSSEAVGGLVAAPLLVLAFVFKVALFFLLFGFVVKAFGGGRSRKGWHSTSGGWAEEARQWHHDKQGGRDQVEETDQASDRFAEWHRMAHARQEVDESVPPVED